MAGTTKSGAATSMNVTGTNPESETNIGGDVVTADAPAEEASDRWTDVKNRVEQVSGIRTADFGKVEFSEGDDEEDVEAFEKAVAKAHPDYAPGRGRQYANTARAMGYTVKLK
jgi:hypothetical protein